MKGVYKIKKLFTFAVPFLFTLSTLLTPTMADAAPVDQGKAGPQATAKQQQNNYKIEIVKGRPDNKKDAKYNKLYLYTNDKVTHVYSVATGRSKDLTPEGTFPLVVKIVKPGWKDIPGGDPRNPLGTRWMGLELNGDRGRTYGIHGTNKPESIGSNASSGCVRMHNKDVEQLFNIVYEGTPVWIHNGVSNGKWRGNSKVGLQRQSGIVTTQRTKTKAWTGPNVGSFVSTTLAKGKSLKKTGISGNWVQVTLPNQKSAFIHKNFLQTAGANTVIVDVDIANIRDKASSSGKVVQKVKYGTILNFIGTSGDYYKLKLSNGKVAYISKTVVQR